jgi:hypothetical protein
VGLLISQYASSNNSRSHRVFLVALPVIGIQSVAHQDQPANQALRSVGGFCLVGRRHGVGWGFGQISAAARSTRRRAIAWTPVCW